MVGVDGPSPSADLAVTCRRYAVYGARAATVYHVTSGDVTVAVTVCRSAASLQLTR